MDTLRQLRDQSFSLFGGMQPHQRLTLAALSIMVMIPFAWLIFVGSDGAYVPLQWGATFDSEKLRQAEQALIERGLNDFRTVGQSIQAPPDKVDEYNAALLSTGNWSPHAVNEREDALEKLSIFTPREHFQAHMDVHLQKDVSRILRSVAGIRSASVLWTRAKTGYRNNGKEKASVYATPSGGGPLTPTLIQSLRMSVSTVLPGLTPESVVVVDQSTGQAWTANSENDLYKNEREARKREIVLEKQTQIQSHLNDTHPGAIATVNIEFDNIMLATERKQEVESPVELTTEITDRSSTTSNGTSSAAPGSAANLPNSVSSNGPASQSTDRDKASKTYSVPSSMTVTSTQYAPLDAQAMQVVVSVPEEHIETLVAMEGTPPGTTDEEKADFRKAVDAKRTIEIEKVRSIVRTLLPGASPDAVTVSTFHRVDPTLPTMDLPATELLRDFVVDWGSTLGLTAFVIWALLMVKKSMPVTEAPPSTDALDRLAEAIKPREPVPEQEEQRTPTTRESLEERVRNNPAVAADIISKMLQTA